MAGSYVFALTIVLWVAGGVRGQCYDPATDDASAQTSCVDAIISAATDTSRYWFGSGFGADCVGAAPTAIACFNPLGRIGYSLLTLLYNENPGFDASLVDRYLGVTYTSPAGEYTGCDHHVVTVEQVFAVDGAEATTYEPWTLRELPSLRWGTDGDAHAQYFVLIMDVGYAYLHGVYSNVVGNDLASATIIKPYAGPKNWRDVANPYVFLVFGQSTTDMVLSSAMQNTIAAVSSASRLDLAAFVSGNALIGPIALNWVVASYDAYSIESIRHRVADNCAFLVSEALENSVASSLPFLPASPEFLIFLHTEYTAPAVSITYCCEDYEASGGLVVLDPIGNTQVASSDLQSMPMVELRETAVGTPSSASNFTGELLTLMLVNPDLGMAPYGSNSHPMIQMLVTNMDAGNILTADTIHAYWQPLPANTSNYYFLLYRQVRTMDINDTKTYSSGPMAESEYDRYMFDIDQFVSDFSLTLVAINRMVVENDPYVNHELEMYGSPVHTCTTPVCPGTDGAGRVNGDVIGITLISLSVMTMMTSWIP